MSRNSVTENLSGRGFIAGVSSLNGFRPHFEDTHVISESLFALFDGHSGIETSQYLKENYEEFSLFATKEKINTTEEIITDLCLSMDDRIKKMNLDSGSTGIIVYADYQGYECFSCNSKLRFFGALCESCPKSEEEILNEEIINKEKSKEKVELKPQKEIPDFASRDILVANIGDSRCIVIHQNGSFTSLSDDHKPVNPIEKKRIEDAGRHVIDGRIGYGLNVSRSFGDFGYKCKPDMDQKDQAVCVVPDFKRIRMNETDLLLICCDGVMETFDRKYCAQFISNQLDKNDLGNICELLCLEALNTGSTDNLTCILVKFEDNRNFTYIDTIPSKTIKYYQDPFSKEHFNVFNQNKKTLKPIIDAIQSYPKKRKY